MQLEVVKPLKPRKLRIQLRDGRELQYHHPFRKTPPLHLSSFIAAGEWQDLEIEIGPGKGEFLAARAAKFPQRFFVGIDRLLERTRLTEKKLGRLQQSNLEQNKNWIVLKEDARSFLEVGIPPIRILHIYQPDPWPKARHHKHRFFRHPDAKRWAQALLPGGELRFSTDNREYFEEIVDIIQSWNLLDLVIVYKKLAKDSPPQTHFENIFLRQGLPVYKAVYKRKS